MELCSIDPAFVNEVFGEQGDWVAHAEEDGDGGDDIDGEPYYKRALVRLALEDESRMAPTDVRRAFTLMHRSRYRRYRVCVRNIGSHRASGVEIQPAAGYTIASGFSPEPFALRPGRELIRDFVSPLRLRVRPAERDRNTRRLANTRRWHSIIR